VLIGIFIYPGVEPIDLATFGVLSMAKRIRPEIELRTIAPHGGPTVLSNGLCVLADYGIARAPRLDVLVVTGGPGWIDQSREPETLAFIRQQAASIPVVSVCTGAMLLAVTFTLLFSPHYAWYFAWLVPFLCFYPVVGVVYLTCACSYLYFAHWPPTLSEGLLIYGPCILILIVEFVLRGRRQLETRHADPIAA